MPWFKKGTLTLLFFLHLSRVQKDQQPHQQDAGGALEHREQPVPVGRGPHFNPAAARKPNAAEQALQADHSGPHKLAVSEL